MKEFFAKTWAWVLKNKVVSIVIASVFTAGVACAVVLPIALKHRHDFGTTYESNQTQHWHECECGEQQDTGDHTEKTAYSTNATHHWKDCEVCGYNMNVTAHTYDKQVANEAYFKEEQSTKQATPIVSRLFGKVTDVMVLLASKTRSHKVVTPSGMTMSLPLPL